MTTPGEKKIIIVTTTTVTPGEKKIIEMLYETAIDLGLTFGFALAGKKVLGITRPSAKMDFPDIAKMTGYFVAGRATREYAQSKGWIPPIV